jgi:hypothetical protein
VSETHAILIAIEHYQAGGKWNLQKAPSRDLLRLADWLIAKGVPADHIHVRISAHDQPKAQSDLAERGISDVEPADSTKVRDLFTQDLPGWSGELILWWSGHGAVHDNERLLFTADAKEGDHLNLSVASALEFLRSEKASNLRVQYLLFDACASFYESAPPPGKLTPGNPLRGISQYCYFAASPGEVAVETGGAGWFTETVREALKELELPLNYRSIRKALEDRYEQLRNVGAGWQRPVALDWIEGSATNNDWNHHGTPPHDIDLDLCGGRAGLATKYLDRLARLSSRALKVRRDAVAAKLRQASAKPFRRKAYIVADPYLDFLMLWAFARENNLQNKLLNFIDQYEQASHEYKAVEQYALAVDKMHELLVLLLNLRIPARVWRAWFAEYANDAEEVSPRDLEGIIEYFFLSANSEGIRRDLLELVYRACRYRPNAAKHALRWLLAQSDWNKEIEKSALPPVQFVFLAAGPDAQNRLVINEAMLWRHRKGAYEPIPMGGAGTGSDGPILDFAGQHMELHQVLSSEDILAPDVHHIVYELALPAEFLVPATAAGHAAPVVVRWLDRLTRNDARLCVGDWIRVGTDVASRAELGHAVRAVWLPPAHCEPDVVKQYVSRNLEAKGGDWRDVVGFELCMARTSVKYLINAISSGAPYACWSSASEAAWPDLESAFKDLLDANTLEQLPYALHTEKALNRSLTSLVLLYDDPRRHPYKHKLSLPRQRATQ